MIAGMRPTTAHTAFSHGISRQRPKWSRVSHISTMSPGRSPRYASGSEIESTKFENGSGTPR